jgi:thioredoxin-like negative regulator of GroEL
VKLADSKTVLKYSLALMLAVRCQNKEACLQLLGTMYHKMDEHQVKTMMMRLIYLLTPTERDWLKGLA